MDSLIYFGGAIKALDKNGRVGGMLITFSDDGSRRDLEGEYFTSKSYLGARDGDGADVLFHHSQPLPIEGRLSPDDAKELEAWRTHLFLPVKTRRTAAGIWAETVLRLSDAYEKMVFEMVEAGKLGFSSGAPGHAVMKAADGQIQRWLISEASFTPTPAEPNNRTLPLKSLQSLKFSSPFAWSAATRPGFRIQSAYARHQLSMSDLAAIELPQ